MLCILMLCIFIFCIFCCVSSFCCAFLTCAHIRCLALFVVVVVHFYLVVRFCVDPLGNQYFFSLLFKILSFSFLNDQKYSLQMLIKKEYF